MKLIVHQDGTLLNTDNVSAVIFKYAMRYSKTSKVSVYI